MNNKTVLKRYPKAVAQRFRTMFKEGFRGKDVPFFVIRKSPSSKFALGFGLTEAKAWQMATIWVKGRAEGDDIKYPLESARMEME